MLETYRQDWVDFVQVQTLCRRAGCRPDELALVAAKELIDNAFDASPRGVEVTFSDRLLFVEDQGPGMSEELALEVFSVKRPSLSSKRWRLARRGALGNGVRVIMGVVHVSAGYLVFESRGLGLVLEVAGADGATTVTKRFPSDLKEGTRIGIGFGERIALDGKAIISYAELCQAAAGSAYGGSKAVPAWFDPPAIRELLRDAREGTSVMEFARLFDLTPDALATIKGLAPRMTTVDVLRQPELLAAVTGAILSGQKGSRELKRLGRNAREGAYAVIEAEYTLGGAKLPAIVEAWVVGEPVKDSKTDGVVWIDTLFANRTPALMALGQGHVSASTKTFVATFGGATFLLPAILRKPCGFSVELAVTAPELPLVSDGKAINIKAFESVITLALREAVPRAYVPPAGKVERAAKREFLTIKDAVYETIEQVYASVAAAGIGAPIRMLMYRSRPAIYRLTGRNSLLQKTFSAAVQSFQDDFPDITKDWSVLYDDRGHFTPPGGGSFGLGTLAVERFIADFDGDDPRFDPVIRGFNLEPDAGQLTETSNPAHRFAAVVFIEKEGYRELFEKARIAERFDVAFASTKGMPTVAIRRLLDVLADYGIRVFILHDFDITGMNIAHTLTTSNERYEFRNDLHAVDMGVRLADAEALGLESEPFHLSDKADVDKVRDRLLRFGATPAEIGFLVDHRHRVEIDAMKPQQLLDFVEAKLTDNGIGKIVPPDTAMSAHFQRATFDARLEKAIAPLQAEFRDRCEALAEELRGSAELDIVVPPLEALVRSHLASEREETWREAVAAIARQIEEERAA